MMQSCCQSRPAAANGAKVVGRRSRRRPPAMRATREIAPESGEEGGESGGQTAAAAGLVSTAASGAGADAVSAAPTPTSMNITPLHLGDVISLRSRNFGCLRGDCLLQRCGVDGLYVGASADHCFRLVPRLNYRAKYEHKKIRDAQKQEEWRNEHGSGCGCCGCVACL